VKENPMIRLLVALVFGLLILGQSAFAAQRTVTLTVNNMYCEACPYMVKKTLEGVSGVSKVTVSFKDATAVVVFDDAKASVQDLTSATAKAGFPSELKG
jgi:mercuric ion binding protein